MANKRALKKRIQQVCGEAAVEVLVSLPEAPARKAVIQLAELQSRSLANVSFAYDRTPRDFANRHEYNIARAAYTRAAFNRLRSDFTKSLEAIVKEINAGLTNAEREDNKAIADE